MNWRCLNDPGGKAGWPSHKHYFFSVKVVRSQVTFINWISNWRTAEIFPISWTISRWCIHYRAPVTSLISLWNNERDIPGITPLKHSLGSSYGFCLLQSGTAVNTWPCDSSGHIFPQVLSQILHPSDHPSCASSRARTLWLLPEATLRSKERGGNPASCWLTFLPRHEPSPLALWAPWQQQQNTSSVHTAGCCVNRKTSIKGTAKKKKKIEFESMKGEMKPSHAHGLSNYFGEYVD